MSKRKNFLNDEKAIQCLLYGFIIIFTSLITLLAPLTAILGNLFANCFRLLFGVTYYVVMVLFLFLGIYMVLKRKLPKLTSRYLIGIIIVLIATAMIGAIPVNKELKGFDVIKYFLSNIGKIYNNKISANGGLFGSFLYSLFSSFLSYVGTIVLIVLLYVSSLFLLVNKNWLMPIINKLFIKENSEDLIDKKPSFNNIKDKISIDLSKRNEKKDNEQIEDKNIDDNYVVEKEIETEIKKDYVVTNLEGAYNTYPNYQLPRLSLLDVQNINKSSANSSVAKQKADQLVEILSQFGINCWLQNIQIGPSITRFELGVETSTRLSKITSIQNNIAMGLSAKKVNIEAPIPGKNAVGIEIENVERNSVRLRDLLTKIPEKKENSKLLIALGKNLAGENEYGEINKMPHLLIAGSTGSGKSVCINSIICTLLFRSRPNEVKMLLIDPKKVEFTAYNDVPHLIAPVINDLALACKSLNTVVQIMDYRYDVLYKKGVKDIDEYNTKCANDLDYKYMYRLVVIIDELADLMLMHGKEIENYIQRITQLARASGIHLIVATQRPSVDVITGTIKSNIPSRIAFAVASATDSRIILDTSGAENLLGYGDMLYLPMGESMTKRIQGVFVSDEEIHRVTEFVKTQGKPMYEDAFIVDATLNSDDEGFNIDDPMFDECKKFIAQTQKASTSSLQRRFGIGYNRAARIIDALEQEGSIGPLQGSKPRDVYIKPDEVV